MVKLIDFSCKHHIMIQNPDGSLSPMDEPFYEAKEIAPGTWQVLSSGDYSYLLLGDDHGLSIDCGYGAGNIREYLESLGGKPVPWVANTHHHFDHSANNAYFDMAYMSEDTVPHVTIPYDSFSGIDFPRDYPITVLGDGDIIPLKGREIQVFLCPDHTDGSLVYLDRKERILFSGDEFFGMGMGKPLNGGLATWIKNLEKLQQYRGEFDCMYGGGGYHPGSTFDAFLECAKYAMDHEGVHFERKPHNPPAPASDGVIIYDRKRPHPGDGAKTTKRIMPDPANMRMVEYAGTKITYDISKKFD